MIRLSIVIPHYNTPDLLQKLLDSIPVDEGIQVIVVDDKSDRDLNIYERVQALGWGKVFQTYRLFRKNRVEVFTAKMLNPLYLLERFVFHAKEKARLGKYYDK